MKLILFDCDGTLVDSQHIIVAAMERAFDAEGFPAPERTAILGIIGLSLPQAVGALVGAEHVGEVPRVVEAYKNSFRDLRADAAHHEPLFPGIEALLHDLHRADDLLLGIVTGKSRRGVDMVLKRFELEGRFATIQTADDAPSKPHPGMVEQALAETGAERQATVVIGDTSFDMQMAKSAGVTAIGVGWGYHPVEALVAAGCDHMCSNVDSLRAAIADTVGWTRSDG
ncbi:HAD-IA family hydrolase [Amorphus orientalis]|uniref:Phosphoglycolate phosphatase n=1 Tax=Amorphus orientalis TaxID=649198 RepID=A0AAE3VPV6_9HYPH|nr:HAD-IA family hydrolase [Amorphus orientalis]MDQ0316099.1 phosphoglycolate phosphatase [Amorphus orientalis]